MTLRAGGPAAEGQLIARIEGLWRGRGSPGVVLAGGDDCAVARPPAAGAELLLTVDQIIENQHFVPGQHPPGALGRKALVRSLSDIAAMGGRPLYFLQTLCLPRWTLGAWVEAFLQGMREAAGDLALDELALIGGDIAHGERFVATVTVVGCVERGTAVRRDRARPGDRVLVSGHLGGSAIGLRMLQEGGDGEQSAAVRRHCWPQPRLRLGRALRRRATAAIDLSDGLAADAAKLAAASGVSLTIDAQAVPRFPGASLADALHSGEEYELLCTFDAGARPPAGHGLVAIGSIGPGAGVWLTDAAGRRPLEPGGFSHF